MKKKINISVIIKRTVIGMIHAILYWLLMYGVGVVAALLVNGLVWVLSGGEDSLPHKETLALCFRAACVVWCLKVSYIIGGKASE